MGSHKLANEFQKQKTKLDILYKRINNNEEKLRILSDDFKAIRKDIGKTNEELQSKSSKFIVDKNAKTCYGNILIPKCTFAKSSHFPYPQMIYICKIHNCMICSACANECHKKCCCQKLGFYDCFFCECQPSHNHLGKNQPYNFQTGRFDHSILESIASE